MQNGFIGDIGDFGKYALLNRLLPKSSKLKLGVLWLLTHEIEKASSLEYLHKEEEKFIKFDAELFYKLKTATQNSRNISSINEHSVLPSGTLFWDEHLHDDSLPNEYWKHYRSAYFSKAALALKDADLIFCDPNNGFHENLKLGNKRSFNLISTSEIKMFWDLRKSILIYSHQTREPPTQKTKRYQRLKKYLGADHMLIFRFYKKNPRDFILVPQKKHIPHFKKSIKKFESEPNWKNFFKIHQKL